ncbi:T9SS type A sorting domain-containing protein [Hymenobacter sp. DH14]|uniref:T9SS type A sorting domain-containing protein n=1 Tax=Hymenobacter cyanobacteriorum TaxID=2926463 RepID=A0A9X1VD22_9BACT|nr:T9SS type A sorting domain-containing protein [Hymenobacter cyanobacteriorum]MCI1186358.1 T9SS type A sorting domain-containing protein [Hymenobacter cyanobacteriorum]
MKQFLYLSLLAAALGSILPRAASAQCTYTAVQSGLFSAASTWAVAGSASCSATPASGSAAKIVISGFNVVLDVPYAIGKDGALTINGQGSLVGGTNLALGDGTGDRADTWLTIAPGSTLRVAQLKIDKASVLIDNALSPSQPTTLTTDCNLVLANSVVTDNSRAVINGSVDVSSGAASNELCGTGIVRIVGCVFGGNGAIKQLAMNCASSLVTTICSQQTQPSGCPGPQAGNNADQRACDGLVPACRPLPVELVIFTASLTSRQGVALHWVTASEKNSQSFVIERSADGEIFKTVRTVAAAGTSSARTTYDQTDEQPLFGTSYYRLRQVDTDGTTAFSPVQLIRLGSANAEGLAVYPGHEAQQWVVSSGLPTAVLASGPASVRVFDALGRSQPAAATPDGSQPGRWALDMRLLPPGMYIVRLVSAAGSFSQRIVQ